MGLRNSQVGLTLALIALLAPIGSAPAGAAGSEVSTQAAAEGTHGLQVNFGPDCSSDQTLDLDADDGPLNGEYEACRTITVESVAVTNGTAILTAGDEIQFSDGFRVETNGALSLVLDAALSGGPTYVEDPSPIEEEIYTASFSARFDELQLTANETIDNLVGYSGTGEVVFRVIIEPANGGGFQLALEARQDGGGMVQTPPGQEIPVASDWNLVDVDWNANAGQGQLLVAINGSAFSGLTDLDNGAIRVETIRWGGVDGDLFDSSGSIQLDSFFSTR